MVFKFIRVSSSKSYLIVLYCLSLLIGVSINRFFSLWLLIEVNIVVFLYVLYLEISYSRWEMLLKYFIVQALSSIIFLINRTVRHMVPLAFNRVLLSVAILMKIGAAPLHWWVVDLGSKSSWLVLLLLLTLQKLLPLFVLDTVANYRLKYIIVFTNMVIGTLLLNQSMLKLLLTYSRIFNLRWIMLISRTLIFTKLFILYTLISGYIMSFLKSIYIESINDSSRLSADILFSLSFRIINLAGFPPFPGFYLKIIVIILLAYIGYMGLMASFLFLSSLRFFGYIKTLFQQWTFNNYRYFKSSYYTPILIDYIIIFPLMAVLLIS